MPLLVQTGTARRCPDDVEINKKNNTESHFLVNWEGFALNSFRLAMVRV